MDKQTIEILLKEELGYSAFEADITAQDLCNLQPQLQPALQKWISSREESDIEIAGFSAVQLMKKKHFTYPAALIALDWLIVDPQTASAELLSDIKH